MDPEPRSERVSRAALTALRSSATSAALFAAVSLVPLVDRAVVRHAKRVAKLEARIPLALRLDAAPPAERPDGDTPPLDDPYAGQQGELLQRLTVLRGLWQAKKPRREEVERTLGWVFRELQSSIVGGTPASFAVTAQWLAAQGRRAEAERALDAGLAEGFRDNETEWVFVAAIRQFGRWSAIAPERWHTPALLDAAFMAGREGGDAANQLLSRITKPGLRAAALGAAALGAGKVPPAWRAELLACDEARAEALCKEEQLWDEGQWAIRFGRAAAVPAPSEAIDEALRAVFTGAQARVRAYVERIHTALAADSTTPDAEKIKALVEQLGDGYLAKELLVSNQPEWLDMFAPLVAESDPAAGGPLREGLAAALAKLPV
jgi:hypothetical protein